MHYLQYLLTDDALRPVPEAVRAGVVPPLTNQRSALWSRDRSPPITAHLAGAGAGVAAAARAARAGGGLTLARLPAGVQGTGWCSKSLYLQM